MELKSFTFTILIILSVKSAYSFPRDVSVAKTDDVFQINDEQIKEKQKPIEDNQPYETTSLTEHVRIPCPFEEATEVEVCQEHCLPKGYTYGICVSRTCSCI